MSELPRHRGAYTENLLIQDRDQLIATGSIVPNNPGASELYLRLISTDTAKRMPLGQEALSTEAIVGNIFVIAQRNYSKLLFIR